MDIHPQVEEEQVRLHVPDKENVPEEPKPKVFYLVGDVRLIYCPCCIFKCISGCSTSGGGSRLRTLDMARGKWMLTGEGMLLRVHLERGRKLDWFLMEVSRKE